MSINEKINLLQSTSSCFSNMSTRYSQPKIKDIRSFHDTIRDTKDHIFNLYEKEPSYKEIMPIISKSNRGNVYYNKFVKINLKNDQRKSAFFQGLMKAIKQIQKEKVKEEDAKREKPKFKHYYIIPKIDILRKKRENFESYYNKKTKTFDNDIKILNDANKKEASSITKILEANTTITTLSKFASSVLLYNFARWGDFPQSPLNRFFKSGCARKRALLRFATFLRITIFIKSIQYFQDHSQTFQLFQFKLIHRFERHQMFINCLHLVSDSIKSFDISDNRNLIVHAALRYVILDFQT